MQARLRGLSADQQELRRLMTMHGYNFTQRVRKVLAMAREEAGRLGHEYVGTEHELLGLIREGEGLGTTALQNLGVDLDELKYAVEEIAKKGSKKNAVSPNDLPYTSRAKKSLDFAMTEARELRHQYVGTEHLLLGLIREEGGIAAQVLVERGVTFDAARREILRILGTDESQAKDRERGAPRSTASDSPSAGAGTQLSERARDIMRDADDVATQLKSREPLPIHIAIALVRNGEGFANAVLDRLKADRSRLIGALTVTATSSDSEQLTKTTLTTGHFTFAWRGIDKERRWQRSPATTLDILLALLDNIKEVASVFETQGIDVVRVRTEARRMSG